jgi:Spy/CpxP family protein refolding chaperone
MKHLKINAPFTWMAAMLLFAFASLSAQAQTTGSPAENTSPPPQTNATTQAPPAQNLPTQLGFTPQQAQQWREINREFRAQEIAAGLKRQQARVALNEAMESANPNEEIIKQRAKDLADAQSAITQLQALRQTRVLQMLTPEQRVKLKEIRERAQGLRRQQEGANALAPGQPLKRNANPPLLTPAQRKALRQQQQQMKRKP